MKTKQILAAIVALFISFSVANAQDAAKKTSCCKKGDAKTECVKEKKAECKKDLAATDKKGECKKEGTACCKDKKEGSTCCKDKKEGSACCKDKTAAAAKADSEKAAKGDCCKKGGAKKTAQKEVKKAS